MINAEAINSKLAVNSTVRISAALGVAALAGGSAFVAYFDPSKSNFMPVCPLFAITGCACPGCGLTRAFHALFHGDIITAIDFNLLTPLWAIIFAYTAISLALIGIRGRGLPMWPTNTRFMTVFGVALISFGVLRNIPIYPFTILFP